jgi:hypothetical protein
MALTDALRADCLDEPGDQGAWQAVPCVDGQARVIHEDGLAELGEGVGGLAGRDLGDVEGLDLSQFGLGRGDVDAEHGGVLGGLAGVSVIRVIRSSMMTFLFLALGFVGWGELTGCQPAPSAPHAPG